ncbi:hypothetical protein F0562_006245 [Nyssa sinensis]|uniref:RRM domain-containing protein n=1 Tax=Nyssa sinensis TaxID=561372 RepID=A0A5J5AP86_9ASTE|nr:hypothetical protein F0562_006245 [Nyssa sinensis]
MESEHGKLFVGGISQITTAEKLIEHFSKYGEVKESQIMKDRNTGNGRGFGFVKFTDPAVVLEVLQVQHNILGRTVEVKPAIPKSEKQQNQHCPECHRRQRQQNNRNKSDENFNIQLKTKKIFVGGLPPNLTEEEFKSYFESFGTITDVIVMYDKGKTRPRGFGFITFDSEEAVDNVLQKNFYELSNKTVEVKRAEPKNKTCRHMSVYDTYNAGLGFGRLSISGGFGLYPPYTPGSIWPISMLPYGSVSGYYYEANPYGVGAPTGVYNGVGYETFSAIAPRSYYYGNPVFYPTYSNDRAYNSGWSRELVDVNNGDVSYHGTPTSVDNDDGGDAEVPACTNLPQIDGASSLQSNGAENQKGADGGSKPCNSS